MDIQRMRKNEENAQKKQENSITSHFWIQSEKSSEIVNCGKKC